MPDLCAKLPLQLPLLAVPLLLMACTANSPPAGGGGSAPVVDPGGEAVAPRYKMANGCYAVQDADAGSFLLAAADGSLGFTVDTAEAATAFYMKPSALGRYLFYDPQGRWMSLVSGNEALADQLEGSLVTIGDTVVGLGDLVAIAGNPGQPINDVLGDVGDGLSGGGGTLAAQINANRSIQMNPVPVDGSEWDLSESGAGFSIHATVSGEQLGAATSAGVSEVFTFVQRPAEECTAYPEAELGATGVPFSGRLADGTVFGYAETHMHLGGSEALGGRLGYGRPYHRFGIIEALNNCAGDHGPLGEQGLLDSAVDPTTTVPNHDTVGWPTYNDWPSWGSQTHHQTYYIWVKRAWMGGLRLMMNHLVANEMLCNVWPHKEHDCNEMKSAALQLELVEGMQDYIDAQEGGPGQGFFRIVSGPEEARAVIESGKLAVINGIELEKPFDCGEYLDAAECSEAEIDARLRLWRDMGLRAVFPVHIFDNAIGGAEIARFTKDPPIMNLYNQGNFVETGHHYATISCDEAEQVDWDEAETEDRDLFGLVATQAQSGQLIFDGEAIFGCQNNARGLTSRGEYFINRLIDFGFIIETDHTGPLARKRMLEIARDRGVPVVSGHTGAVSHARDSKRILEIGGILSNLSDDPPEVSISFIQDLVTAYREVYGHTEGLSTGFGADINGIHKQPRPRDDAAEKPLEYPFTSYDGQVLFERQVTGQRSFDLNQDGVAHYGLYPDWIADWRNVEGGEDALQYVFRSAEGYLKVWETVDVRRVEE